MGPAGPCYIRVKPNALLLWALRAHITLQIRPIKPYIGPIWPLKALI